VITTQVTYLFSFVPQIFRNVKQSSFRDYMILCSEIVCWITVTNVYDVNNVHGTASVM